MEKSKIKNFIIVLLALVNLFLLIIVVSEAVKTNEAQQYKITAVKNVFSENGITIQDSVDLLSNVPEALYLKRDATAEKYRAARLIGDCNTENLGGNIYRYTGTKGTATFRGTGEFEITFATGEYPRGDDAEQTAIDALETLGIELAKGEEIPAVPGGDSLMLVLTCAYEGVPVFNAQVTFSFSNDSLLRISGRRPLDTAYSVQSTQATQDSITALMNFLYYVRDSGQVCTEITGLSSGYSVQTAVSGDCSLNPVWCITSDTGRYYVDGITGKTEKI